MNKSYSGRRAERLLARLLRISKMPVAQARGIFGELLRARFGDVVRVGVALESTAALRDATDEDVRAWQQSMLNRISDDVKFRRETRALIGQGISIKSLDMAFINGGAGGSFSLEMKGELDELLAMQTCLLASVVGPKRIRECDCGKWFLKLGKREFCSPRCQKRVYMRGFRKRDA